MLNKAKNLKIRRVNLSNLEKIKLSTVFGTVFEK